MVDSIPKARKGEEVRMNLENKIGNGLDKRRGI
jgi:hypothetical protein